MSRTIYDTYAERCSQCGAGERSWHHNPPIGGSALDHPFTPSRSVMEALCAIGGGRPFARVELTDFEFYALRSYAMKGLDAAAQEHPECGRVGCDVCAMREEAERYEERARRSREDSAARKNRSDECTDVDA